MMRAMRWFLLLAVLLLTGCTHLHDAGTKTEPVREYAVIEAVVDGDTLVTAQGDRVRLLGIDAPESGERYAANATRMLKDYVLGRNVTLEHRRGNRGRYGRLLRVVRVNDTLVNRVLVAEGLATRYYLNPAVLHRDTLDVAEAAARERGQGLWTPSPYTGCVSITGFHWDAPGNDNDNRNQENVTFHNRCSEVDLDGWTVMDHGTKRYTFEAVVPPDGSVTLYSGSGEDTDAERFWGAGTAVWNNDGDRLFLRDRDGLLVAHRSYGRYR